MTKAEDAMDMDIETGDDTHTALPPQVLCSILSRLSLPERMASCSTVCRSWHRAAIATTTKLQLEKCSTERCSSLSAWLLAYGAAAAVRNLEVSALRLQEKTPFQLPSQQLTDLHRLHLSDVAITPAAGAAPGPSAGADAHQHAAAAAAAQQPWRPVWMPELSALTELDLNNCTVSFVGLHFLTSLKILSVKHGFRETFSMSGSQRSTTAAVLAAALPALTQLTTVQLAGACCVPAVLEAAGQLPHLQALGLEGSVPTTSVLPTLPDGLTFLSIDSRFWPAPQNIEPVTPANAARFSQLTTLRDLRMHTRECVHPAVFEKLRHLRKLQVLCGSMRRAPAEPGLRVLACMQDLQELQLDPDDGNLDLVLDSDADVAALTASSQLMELTVLVPAARFPAFFPSGQTLPKLVTLRTSASLLLEHAVLERFTAFSPQLTRLDVISGRPVLADPLPDADALVVLLGLRKLSGFQDLRRVFFYSVPLNGPAWKALAALPNLRHLTASFDSSNSQREIMHMTACRGLTCLQTEFFPEGALQQFRLGIDVTNTAPAGRPSNVWCRLPAEALQAACDVVHPALGNNPNLLDFYHHLTSEAAKSMNAIQVEQQQEMLQLSQRTAALEQGQAALQQGLLEVQSCSAAAAPGLYVMAAHYRATECEGACTVPLKNCW